LITFDIMSIFIDMKSRPVKIDEDVYSNVKEYCEKNALKISKWISRVLSEKLDVEKKLSKSTKK